MNFYLAVVLMWVAIGCTVAACCGLYAICAKGYRAWTLRVLWADGEPDGWERENVRAHPVVFPREWTLNRPVLYDQDNDAA